MKLSLKLPLAFVGALLALLAAALFGMTQLNRALSTYETTVQEHTRQEREVGALLDDFKTQVQEWKNVLLRGKDPKQLERYWAAFEKQDAAVATDARKLQEDLQGDEAGVLISRFREAHRTMGAAYRKGLDAYKAADFEAAAGDRAVQGLDREPARLLGEAGEKIAASSQRVAAEAKADARRALIISLAAMLAVCAGAIVVSIAFSRSVVRPLTRAYWSRAPWPMAT